jgi:hypothetical protein
MVEGTHVARSRGMVRLWTPTVRTYGLVEIFDYQV